LVVGLSAALALSPAAVATGHVRKASGSYEVELGWAEEPAFSGARNAVEVTVEDRGGRRVADPRASLRVELRFGEAVRTLTLAPAGASRSFMAAIVPTRPGSYAFHVTGTVRGRAVDVEAACSERTFDCVDGAETIQFPVADPPAAQLDRKLDRALARADRAGDRAASAQTVAALAVVVAVLALVAAFLLARRRARQD
jgi:hypothetical protein